MIASQILLVTVWFVAFPSGLTATTEVLDLETEVNQAKSAASRGLRGAGNRLRSTFAILVCLLIHPSLAVEEKPQKNGKCAIPPSKHHITPKSESNRRKQLPSKKDKVVSLHGYSKKLTELQAEIQQQFKWIREGEKNPTDNTMGLSRAEELFNSINEMIPKLKSQRLMQLGVIDNNISDDLLRLMYEPITTKLFEAVKQFIKENSELFTFLAFEYVPQNPKFLYGQQDVYRLYTMTAFDYAFKLIDFLFEKDFITTQQVRSMIEDKEMVNQVVNYTVRCYENQFGFYSWIKMDNLTKHWHWGSLNKYSSGISTTFLLHLKAWHSQTGVLNKLLIAFTYDLSNQQLDIIDLVFLLGRAACTESGHLKVYEAGYCLHIDDIDTPFSYKNYFSKSSPLEKSNKLSLPGQEILQIDHGIHLKLNEKEMDEIVHKLVPPKVHELQLNSLVNLFAFMEEEICPGIISRVVKNHTFFIGLMRYIDLRGCYQKPEDIFNLVSLYSRNEILNETANQSIKSVHKKGEIPSVNKYVTQNKQIYRSYISKKQEILDKYKYTYERFSGLGVFGGKMGTYCNALYRYGRHKELNNMKNTLDNTEEYQEIPDCFIHTKQQPHYPRALS
ncbi:hypothetical protein MJO28_005391 [Puccinia striiformis f. sp. tritici]|uniref:Uncharacterized protein n=1 Tax=Puccinia striiformis f. sp. tritici TaxID=168172 RepID=A0ACC0EK65_9BASI|nr:hypothetical protein MJO28_005391 [Puccinia striiformis f. sp. tritici]